MKIKLTLFLKQQFWFFFLHFHRIAHHSIVQSIQIWNLRQSKKQTGLLQNGNFHSFKILLKVKYMGPSCKYSMKFPITIEKEYDRIRNLKHYNVFKFIPKPDIHLLCSIKQINKSIQSNLCTILTINFTVGF